MAYETRFRKFSAPRYYQRIPSETDHNRYPFLTDFPEVLAFATDHRMSVFLDISEEANVIAMNLNKKVKHILSRVPYSKAQVSIAVQHIGHTLLLNHGKSMTAAVCHAYRKKRWGVTNPDLIDQVSYHHHLIASDQGASVDIVPSLTSHK
ncbi:hypothetical protein F2Q70_00012743 [Brassica cretica]|uniref:Uncharacterized protein n=1 Tax=Brassica cretica TaxID=69181 RepID=A0A8S9M989_BRACR|nr:hypothetical protein F2Q70_00012743 [Brassica cretica]